MIGTVVGGQRVFLAIERELALGDAIGDAAGGAAEILVILGLIAGDRVEAEYDIGGLALLVGHVQFGERRAAGHDLRDHALVVLEGVKFDRRSVGRLAERCRPTNFGGAGSGRDRHEQGSPNNG